MNKLLYLCQYDVDTDIENHYILNINNDQEKQEFLDLKSFNSRMVELINKFGKIDSLVHSCKEYAYYYSLLNKMTNEFHSKIIKISEINLMTVKRTKSAVSFFDYIYCYILGYPYNLVFLNEDDLDYYICNNIPKNENTVNLPKIKAKFVNPLHLGICIMCCDFFDANYTNVCDNCHKPDGEGDVNFIQSSKRAKLN